MAVKLFVPSESGMSRLPFIGLAPGLANDSDHTLLDMRCRQSSEVFTRAQIQRSALAKPAPALPTWRHASAVRTPPPPWRPHVVSGCYTRTHRELSRPRQTSAGRYEPGAR